MNDNGMSLKARAIRRLVITLAVIAALILGSAGSLRFWQGWLFLLLMASFWIAFFVDLLKHDPKLVERRLQRREAEPAQKLFQKLFSAVFFSSFCCGRAGLPFRLVEGVDRFGSGKSCLDGAGFDVDGMLVRFLGAENEQLRRQYDSG